MPSRYSCLLMLAWLPDCDPAPQHPDNAGIGDATDASSCGRGFVIVSSDYQSSDISLLSADGNWLTPLLLGSGSADPGLSQALSGDIALPTKPVTDNELVLLDRYPASVLSFVNLRDGKVRAQLDVSTGFAANPHDYVPISATKAYVTRFEPNPEPGRQAHDAGSDLLIVDPSVPAIQGRIALKIPLANSTLRLHPERALRVGTQVRVVAASYSLDYRQSGPSYLITVDTQTDRQVDVLELPEVQGCAGLALSPAETELAVACSGAWRGSSSAGYASSALLRLSLTPALKVLSRFEASSLSPPSAFSFGVTWQGNDALLATVFGNLGGGGKSPLPDRLVRFPLQAGPPEELDRSQALAFSFGDPQCSRACSQCLLPDATAGGSLRLWDFRSAAKPRNHLISNGDPLGLPPRRVVAF